MVIDTCPEFIKNTAILFVISKERHMNCSLDIITQRSITYYQNISGLKSKPKDFCCAVLVEDYIIPALIET